MAAGCRVYFSWFGDWTGMPVSAEIARTLMPAASSGAILARLVSCLSRALGDANGAVSMLIK